MYGQTFHYDARLDSDEPSGDEACGDPQCNFEGPFLKDAGVEEKDGIFGHSYGDSIDGFVDVAGLLSALILSDACETVLLQ